jgi:hypothetical protein
MSQSSDGVETLGGRGTVVAFLDLLFSCIGIFIAVITLQSVATQQSPPAVGADAYFGLLAVGSILQATAEGVRTPSDVDGAVKSSLAATDSAYPRVEVLFSGSAIRGKRAFEGRLGNLVASLNPARTIEANWRPAASDDMVREELERIAGALRVKETR